MSSARKLKRQLNSIIHQMAENPSAFVVNPGIDFSRKRMLDFETMMRMLITFGGQTLRKEIYNSLKEELCVLPSASAFTQQRQKIKPDAFYYAFRQFNDVCSDMDKGDDSWYGYRILAVDGSDVNIPYNENSDTFMTNGSSKGFNQFHVNALYDLMKKVYLDAMVEPRTKYNEARAAGTMVKRSAPKRSIIIGDRGYGSVNLIETLKRASKSFVIRVKNDWIREIADLPMEELDTHVVMRIYTSVTSYKKAQRRGEKNIHMMPGPSKFGKDKKRVGWDYGDGAVLGFRVVRFQLDSGEWETLVTDLNSAIFTIKSLKKLYHMRWGIETSFRDLKYSIGLTNFHARNEESILQEIYARLLMYNFAERVISGVVIQQREDNIHQYRVDFSTSAYVIRDFLRTTTDPPGNIEDRLCRYTVPIRPDRHDIRKMMPKNVIVFMYRVA